MKAHITSLHARLDAILTKHLALRKGERRLVFLLQGNIFLIISILLILKPLFTGLMLAEYTVSIMPTAYLSIAATALFVHAIISALTNRYRFFSILIGNHLFNIILLIVIGYFLHRDAISGLWSIGLYLYISMYALVTVTYFYQYCQSLLSVREAKRLYAYIGSGAIAGGVAGGYLTSLLMDVLGMAGLVWMAAALLLLSLALYHYSYHLQYEADDAQEIFLTKNIRRRNAFFALKNKHVSNIAILMGLGVIVSRMVDYQFNYVVTLTLKEAEDLASFFGFWFSTINVVSFCLQLFVVSKVVERWGIQSSLLSLPVLIAVGLAVILMMPVLATAIAIKMIDGSLKQSLYKTGTELVIMPLSNNVRQRAKTLIDVVIDSIATGIAGISIYLISIYLRLPLNMTIVLTLFLCGMWIYFIRRSSQSYGKALLNRVVDSTVSLERSDINRNIIKTYIDENFTRGISKVESLRQLMEHQDSYVRTIALRRLIDQYGSQEKSTVMTMLNDPSLDIRKDALDAVVDWISGPKEVHTMFTNATTANKMILLSALADSFGQHALLLRKYSVKKLIDETLSLVDRNDTATDVHNALHFLYRSIAVVRHRAQFGRLLQMINDPISSTDQHLGLDAITYGENRSFYDKIDQKFIQSEHQNTYFRYLATFPQSTILRIRSAAETDPIKALQILPAAAFIDTQDNIDMLHDLLDHHSLRIRRRALRLIKQCSTSFPYLNYKSVASRRRLHREIKMLRKLMVAQVVIGDTDVDDPHRSQIMRGIRRELDASLLRIMIYLALIIKNDDISPIYDAFRGKRKKEALDLLDNMLPYKIKVRLMPVLDILIHNKINEATLKAIGCKMMSKRKAVRFLTTLPDSKLQRALKKSET